MSVNKLKLISTDERVDNNIPFLIVDGSTSWDGETPVLAYYGDNQELRVLNKGGSDRVDLLTCEDLKNALDLYMFKGTKYIASTYDPTLYYLFPGVSENDELFKTENDFIPTLSISNAQLKRMEVDGFNKDAEVLEGELRCMKACDSWFNDLSKYEELVQKIDERVEEVFGCYKEFESEKEVNDQEGRYSSDLAEYPLVVSLISGTTYTDTINLEDWVFSSNIGASTMSGKLDISYMYSIEGEMYSGMQTIKAFQYEENVTSNNIIMNFGDSCPIQIEYMDYVLKIYPMEERVDEVVFTDCTLTIGVL